MEKYALSNVVLYSKNWYLKTDNIIEDLKAILELDGYCPQTRNDVYSILLKSIETLDLETGYKFYEMRRVLDGIRPNNCWKYGYLTRDFEYKREGEIYPEYDFSTAFIYYVISSLRDLETDNWKKIIPQYKKYPKRKGVDYKTVYEMFNGRTDKKLPL